MPQFSVYSVRAALLYLALGFTIGGLLLFHKGIPLHPILWTMLPAHIDFLLIGWTAQLIMGVSFWILPQPCLDGFHPGQPGHLGGGS
jgi:hypothetical protein